MFGLRLPELLLILLAVLLLFGGNKLPQLGKGLGESVRSFRRALRDGKEGEADPAAKDQVSNVK
ncbi:MAG TPA: twin-arginine translocase TatA/TatE family subunit [Anaeromyxobacteraceae bacterium]|jgi:sec-independent protein translocase protein TatA